MILLLSLPHIAAPGGMDARVAAPGPGLRTVQREPPLLPVLS